MERRHLAVSLGDALELQKRAGFAPQDLGRTFDEAVPTDMTTGALSVTLLKLTLVMMGLLPFDFIHGLVNEIPTTVRLWLGRIGSVKDVD